MGLNGLLGFIKTKYPDLLQTEHVSRFARQRVFVDIASYIYKYVCIHGALDNRWIHSLVGLIGTFVKNNVHVIPVFDGKPPSEKQDEIEERREKRKRQADRITNLKTMIQAYKLGSRLEDVVNVLKHELENLEKKGGTRLQRLLRPNSQSASITESQIAELENYASSLESGIVTVTETDMTYLKTLFNAMGITVLQAPQESESYCCFLVRNGVGSAVVSCDTDCIAHRADTIVFSIESSGTITTLELTELLEAFGLEEDQLADFGILIGCDYNKGSRVNKIGPVNALKLLRQYGKIEDIPNINTEVLKYEECRKLFNPEEYDKNVVVKSVKIDEDQLKVLCWERRLNFNFVMDSCTFKKVEVKFE
jgi:5'-3' exonuclease